MNNCPHYVGEYCINGNCPAIIDRTISCHDCHKRKGCRDCILFDRCVFASEEDE